MAYGTDIGATQYHTLRNNTAWAEFSQAVRTGSRVRASDYIDAMYGSRFPGTKTGGRAQADQWPRTGAVDASGNAIANDEIPSEIVTATYELSLMEANKPGLLTPVTSYSDRKVLTEVKGIKWTIVGGQNNGGTSVYLPKLPTIDGILSGLLGYPEIGAVLVV